MTHTLSRILTQCAVSTQRRRTLCVLVMWIVMFGWTEMAWTYGF